MRRVAALGGVPRLPQQSALAFATDEMGLSTLSLTSTCRAWPFQQTRCNAKMPGLGARPAQRGGCCGAWFPSKMAWLPPRSGDNPWPPPCIVARQGAFIAHRIASAGPAGARLVRAIGGGASDASRCSRSPKGYADAIEMDRFEAGRQELRPLSASTGWGFSSGACVCLEDTFGHGFWRMPRGGLTRPAASR